MFPLVAVMLAAAPVVSPDVQLDLPVPSRAFDQINVAVAAGTLNGLAVWEDERPPRGLYLTRFDLTSGVPLSEPTRLPVNATGAPPLTPAVAFGDGKFLVAFVYANRLAVIRVAQDGTLIDSTLTITNSTCTSAAVTADATSFVAVCSSQNGLRGRRVPFTGAIIGSDVAISSTAELCVPAIAFGGGELLTGCAQDNTHNPQVFRLGASLQVLSSHTLATFASTVGQQPRLRLAIASNGARFFVLWKYQTDAVAPAQLGLRSLDPGGVVVEAAPVIISSAARPDAVSDYSSTISVACDPSSHCNYAFAGSGALQRLMGGTIQYPSSTTSLGTVDGTADLTTNPAFWRRGGLAWVRRPSATEPRASVVARPYNSFPLGAAGPLTLLALGPNVQRVPEITFDGASSFAVWVDDRLPEQPQLYGVPLDPGGAPIGPSMPLSGNVAVETASAVRIASVGGVVLASFSGRDPNTNLVHRWAVRVAGSAISAPVDIGQQWVIGSHPTAGFLLIEARDLTGTASLDLVGTFWPANASAPGATPIVIAADQQPTTLSAARAIAVGDTLAVSYSRSTSYALARLQSDGGWSAPAVITNAGFSQMAIEGATDGERLLYTWVDTQPVTRVRYNLFDPATGARVFAADREVSTGVSVQTPIAAFNGTDFIVGWRRSPNLDLVRINRAGALLDVDGGHFVGTTSVALPLRVSMASGTRKRTLFATQMTSGDDGGPGAVRAVSRLVAFPNTPPIADGLDASVPEDGTLWLNASGVDDDGDALSFELIDAPTSGTVRLDGGSIWYQPAPDFSGLVQFSYGVRDDSVLSTPAVVQVEVTPVNDAPVTSALTQTFPQGTAQLTLTASDVDGDALTWSVTTPPAHGTVTGAGPSFNYTSADGHVGSDPFVVTVSDGVATAQAAVDLTITNAAPTVSASVDDDSPRAGREVHFSATGADPGRDALTFTWAFPDGTTATGAQSAFTFSMPGMVNVVCTVSDGREQVSAVVRVNVRPEIPEALAISGLSMVDEGTSATWELDVPPDAPTNLVFTWDFGDGSAMVTGRSQQHTFLDDGVFTVRVTATSSLGSVVISREVTVRNVAPMAVAVTPQSVEAGQELLLELVATDVGADTLTWTQISGPGQLTPGGSFRWRSELGVEGRFDVVARVSDGDGGEAELVFSIEAVREVQKVLRPGCGCVQFDGGALLLLSVLALRRSRRKR